MLSALGEALARGSAARTRFQKAARRHFKALTAISRLAAPSPSRISSSSRRANMTGFDAEMAASKMIYNAHLRLPLTRPSMEAATATDVLWTSEWCRFLACFFRPGFTSFMTNTTSRSATILKILLFPLGMRRRREMHSESKRRF